MNPFHLAAAFSSGAVVEEILKAEKSADDADTCRAIKTQDSEGKSPLHFAARYSKRADVLQLLINWGADLEAPDDEEQSIYGHLSSLLQASTWSVPVLFLLPLVLA